MFLCLTVAGYLVMTANRLMVFRGGRRAGEAAAEDGKVLPLLGTCNGLRAPYLLLLAPGRRLPTSTDFGYERGGRVLQRPVGSGDQPALPGRPGARPLLALTVYAAGFAVHLWGWYGADPEWIL